MLTSPSGLIDKKFTEDVGVEPTSRRKAVLPLGLALLDLKLIPSLFFSEIIGEEANSRHPTKYVC